MRLLYTFVVTRAALLMVRLAKLIEWSSMLLINHGYRVVDEPVRYDAAELRRVREGWSS